MNHILYLAFVFTTCVVLMGCGHSDNLSRASLTGKVTYQGQPLDHGMIGLLPIDGTKGPQGSGVIRSDGTYEIVTAGKPGAVVGLHKIIVQCRQKLSDEEKRQMKVGRLLTPNRYAAYTDTPLRVEVPPNGTVFNIDMTD